MARRVYTEHDRAHVFAVLTANEGNVKRTARETGFPVQTVRDWKTTWEKNGGPPEQILEVLPEVAGDFIDDATRIRNKALTLLEAKIDRGEVTAKDLLVAVGVLTDKVRLIQGQATSRTETVHALPSPEEFGQVLVGYLEQAVEMQELRAADIEDAEFEEAGPIGELPPADV